MILHLIFLSFLFVQTATAAVQVSPTTTGINQTSTLQQSDKVYIRIAKPNDQGVSLNYFSELTSPNQPIVLLNSRWMNTKVAQAPAQTIVLVVDKNQRANIGHLRVEGHSADIVLLAPKGIQCDGCVVENTPRLTMATGTLNTDNGTVDSFDINGGDVRISGAGLVASQIALLDIAAGKIIVDGPLRTNMKGREVTRNNQQMKTIDSAGSLEVSNGDVQMIVGKNHFRYANRQSDASYQFAMSSPLELTNKADIHVGNLYLESTYDGASVSLHGRVNVQGAWVYVGRYQNKNIVPLESITVKSNGQIYLYDQLIAANKVSLESLNNILIEKIGTDSNNLPDNIQGADVNIAAVGSVENTGSIAAESLYTSANSVLNEGNIEASREIYLNGKNGVINQFGGVIIGENIRLKSDMDVLNGALYPFKPAVLCTRSYVTHSKQTIEVGGKLSVPPFTGCGKEPVDTLNAYILGQNIKVEARRFTNANPYEVSRQKYTDPELTLDPDKSEGVIISAESVLDIRVTERFWNMSAVAESWTGNMIIQASIIDNERYHIWADTYNSTTNSTVNNSDLTTNSHQQYIKVLSPPAKLHIGKDLILNSEMLNNEHSVVEVRHDVFGSASKVWMEGLLLRDIAEQTTVTHYSRRYCSRRAFRHCIHHKTARWTTSSQKLTQNSKTGEYPFIFYVDGTINQGFGITYNMLQNITYGPHATPYELPDQPKPPKPSKYIPIILDHITIMIPNPNFKEGN